jgi:hypothetical protein
MHKRLSLALVTGCALWTLSAFAQTPPTFPGLTIELEDHVAMPITGKLEGAQTPDESSLSRINGIREETGGSHRWFLPVVSGPIYIYDKSTKAFATYLDFNGHGENRGLFKKFFTLTGFGNGINGFALDPEYRTNGKFYTTHMEDPSIEASGIPQNAMFPGLQTAGYTVTTPIATPGPVMHQGVLIEWTDTNPSNTTFEGTAREVFRVWMNTRNHQLGELVFNPSARPGDADWRVMYVDVGDGGSGESRNVDIRPNPQRLDAIVGKIVRIIPDLSLHTANSTVSENGRYRIPNDNPFVKTPGARKEIWAYGLRNPHRLTFAVDPANVANNRLVASICGLNTWEMISIIHKGANYGFPYREGPEAVTPDNGTAPLPDNDTLPVMIDDKRTAGTVKPTYPVIIWAHDMRGGDCAGSGYLYNGKSAPALRGKFVYGDITTGRIWYSDYNDMLAADDGNPKTMAKMYEVKIRWNNEVHDTMMPIVSRTFRARGSKAENMNGKGRVSGERADMRLTVDAAGEMYVYSKSDGMIRKIVGATPTR